ncbi:Uncharacterised protein [Burkholderia pseudomallei]|nr:Uncharacterised protein [Burkholderia pseudomallei]
MVVRLLGSVFGGRARSPADGRRGMTRASHQRNGVVSENKTGLAKDGARAASKTTAQFVRLDQAAKQLGWTPDDLLDRGVAGDIRIYAPVLYEGVYEWPVSNLGLVYRAPEHQGNVPFRTKLRISDYVVLAREDIKRISLAGWVIPEDFLCPSVALEVIEHWKEKQQEKSSVSDSHDRDAEDEAPSWPGALVRVNEQHMPPLYTRKTLSLKNLREGGEASESDVPDESPRRVSAEHDKGWQSREPWEHAYERMKSLVWSVPWTASSVPDAREIVTPERYASLPERKRPTRDEYKVRIEMLRVCSDDIARLRAIAEAEATEKRPEMPKIDDGWQIHRHLSNKLKALIEFSGRWEEKPYHEGLDQSEYRDWHNAEIKQALAVHPVFNGRSELARHAAEFVRPLYSRRSGRDRNHPLFQNVQSPELRALYHAARLWEGWAPESGSKPSRQAVEETIRKYMCDMQLDASATLLDAGPKIIQPESAESGQERQAQRATRAWKKK